MSRWLLPVPESPINTTGSPASIHAPLASAARLAGLTVGAAAKSKSSRRLRRGKASFEQAAGPATAVAVVDLGGEHLGQIGPMGEPFFGGRVGQRCGLGAHRGQVQHPAGGTDSGLGGRFAQSHGRAHDALPTASRRRIPPSAAGAGRRGPRCRSAPPQRRAGGRRCAGLRWPPRRGRRCRWPAPRPWPRSPPRRACAAATAAPRSTPGCRPRRPAGGGPRSRTVHGWPPNAPAARAWARAVEPGMAPGLRTRISR